MRILLINPPRSPENSILKFAPAEAKKFIHKKLIGPPLGLLTIASAISDYDVEVFDTKGEYDLNPDSPPIKDLVKKQLEKFKPEIVGVTFIASELYSGIEILKAVKEYNSEILTVAGGLHTTLSPEDFTDTSVDLICPGQSPGIFRKIVQAKEKKSTFSIIPGIIINNKEGHNFTGKPQVQWDGADKDFLMPNRNHIKKWISTYKVGDSPYPSTYIFTSLGCPYACTFCSIWPQFKGKYHQRNIESIITELKSIDDYKVVRFADANTIVNVKFIDKLFDRILEEGIEKIYIMDIRFDTAAQNPGLIEKLAKAGLKVVICGFESFRKEELEKYKKNASPHLIEKAIEIFHQNDIMLRGNYVIPNNYDHEDFKALEEFASTNPVVYAGYTILTPMPGTDLFSEMKNDIIDFDLSKYNFFNCVLKTKIPIEKFYEKVGNLWLIKKGQDVI